MPPFNVVLTFANCTHIINCESSKRKVTVVRTDAPVPPFHVISRTYQKLFFQTKNYKKVKMKGGLSWI